MIYTAYMDESNTHGDTPTIIMAAFLGHTYQWRRFEIKLARIQKAYGFHIFHAKEFKRGSGEFRGWSQDKKSALIHDLSQLVEQNLTEGIAVHLEHDRYVNEYKVAPIPSGMRLDSHYGVCFRACIARMRFRLRENGAKDTLNIVLEKGHKNAPDCERIFHQFKTLWQAHGADIFGTFKLQDKKSCMPLMVADMLAAAYSMMRDRNVAGDASMNQYKMEKPKKGSLVFIELAPDSLRNLKSAYETNRRLRIEQWHAKKEANTTL